jgi:hypothetical protein
MLELEVSVIEYSLMPESGIPYFVDYAIFMNARFGNIHK